MRILLHVLACLLLFASAKAAVRETGVWEVLEDCRLIKAGLNDGDSFLVKHGDEEFVFRLYYVDAPETYDTYMDRVRDQARYFSMPDSDVLASGELAARFTQHFLHGDFTVMTKWEDGRGGDVKRYFGMIRNGDDYLSMELVRHGLARIYGMPTVDRWPSGYEPHAYLSLLKNVERQAQRDRTGIWALAGASHQMAGLNRLSEAVEGEGMATIATPVGGQRRRASDMINVNTASAAELQTLDGIGPALAAAIIAARPFETIEALTDIQGISPKKLAAIRSKIILATPPPPPKTADFYLADLETYQNTDITVVVASVAKSDVSSPESFRTVHLETAFDGKFGGGITAFIPDEFYDAFIQHYSQSGREFTGLLFRHDGQPVLVYRRK